MADEVAALRVYEFYLGWFSSPLLFGDYPVTMKRRGALERDLRDFTADSGAQIVFEHAGDTPKGEVSFQ
ncbi:hypothetical protein K7X08_003338 [Anisodus acutangulus]|uniref:Uncharacterized protein n=1 Tax=Anisodus acutangulus TaxID=402998 RepID=A0A9Q1MF58_9SOLA|nr:hypothetical protein K7X08_003338 [Anisodus acutangulus]